MIRNRARIGDAPLYIPGEPLFSFSQDPRVASNRNPIYAPGSPQYNAAVAAGAVDPNSGRSYTPYVVPAPPSLAVEGPAVNMAPGTWNGDCNNPVVADAQGNLAYVKACYPNTPLGAYLASQPAGGPLTLNPTVTPYTAAPLIAPAAPAPTTMLSALTGLPWYYYAGGAAALLFLFSGKK